MKKIFILGFVVMIAILVLIGCDNENNVTNNTNLDNETVEMPDESYIGNWYTKDSTGSKYDNLIISEINNDNIKFTLSVFRLCIIEAIATIDENAIKFIALDPSGDDNIYGTLEFINNIIYLTIDQQNWEYELPKSFTFDYKE